jgi:two-component system NtrC family response regulator
VKIAIVEDDINMRKSLSLALKSEGYEVVEFRNVLDALKKLDDSVDLIIQILQCQEWMGLIL